MRHSGSETGEQRGETCQTEKRGGNNRQMDIRVEACLLGTGMDQPPAGPEWN